MKKILSDTEFMIMQFIWRCGKESVTASEIREHFESCGKSWKKQTVSTYLKKLTNHGYLKLTIASVHYFYSPVITETDHMNACKNIVTDLFNKDLGGVYCTLWRATLLDDEKNEIKTNLLNDLDN